MNLVEFLDLWANPSNRVAVYFESDYSRSVSIINDGSTWNDVRLQIVPEITFNPKMGEISVLSPRVIKAAVTHFVVTDCSLIIFVSDKRKNIKNS